MLCHSLPYYLSPGVSINVELDWWAASPSEPPIPARTQG